MQRRDLLRLIGGTGAVLATTPFLQACSATSTEGGAATTTGGPTTTGATGTTAAPTTTFPPFDGYGPLGDPDVNGLRLPDGFSSRIVATSGQTVENTDYTWHANPDGGACFETPDGGWIYTSNSETLDDQGGASMLRFAPDGSIVEAKRILDGTNFNCAGGATPWNTWLSCEEIARGTVWECDPFGVKAAEPRPAMGKFAHEAVAVDEKGTSLYLTEDHPTGGLYRFTPTAWPDLSAGDLEVMTESATGVAWEAVPDPSGDSGDLNLQVPGTKAFAGGEGITFNQGNIYFTTKYDGKVWCYDTTTNSLTTVYDPTGNPEPVLNGVDNVTSTERGDLYVAEDGHKMQIVMLSGTRVDPVVQITGVEGSEVCGPAFSPDGTRFYFSSQRNPGTTYEVMGPWRMR